MVGAGVGAVGAFGADGALGAVGALGADGADGALGVLGADGAVGNVKDAATSADARPDTLMTSTNTKIRLHSLYNQCFVRIILFGPLGHPSPQNYF